MFLYSDIQSLLLPTLCYNILHSAVKLEPKGTKVHKVECLWVRYELSLSELVYTVPALSSLFINTPAHNFSTVNTFVYIRDQTSDTGFRDHWVTNSHSMVPLFDTKPDTTIVVLHSHLPSQSFTLYQQHSHFTT